MHTAVEAGIHVQALASAIVGCVLDGVEGRQMYGVVRLGLELGAETLTSRHIVHCVYPRAQRVRVCPQRAGRGNDVEVGRTGTGASNEIRIGLKANIDVLLGRTRNTAFCYLLCLCLPFGLHQPQRIIMRIIQYGCPLVHELSRLYALVDGEQV